jgi:hypothetical protein
MPEHRDLGKEKPAAAAVMASYKSGAWGTAAVSEEIAALGSSAVLMVLSPICEEQMLVFLIEEQSALAGTVS